MPAGKRTTDIRLGDIKLPNQSGTTDIYSPYGRHSREVLTPKDGESTATYEQRKTENGRAAAKATLGDPDAILTTGGKVLTGAAAARMKKRSLAASRSAGGSR